jgi:hypothetical protein
MSNSADLAFTNLASRADCPWGDRLTVIDATKVRELNDNRGTD